LRCCLGALAFSLSDQVEHETRTDSTDQEYVLITIARRVNNDLKRGTEDDFRWRLDAIKPTDRYLIIQGYICRFGPGNADADAIVALSEYAVEGHASVHHVLKNSQASGIVIRIAVAQERQEASKTLRTRRDEPLAVVYLVIITLG